MSELLLELLRDSLGFLLGSPAKHRDHYETVIRTISWNHPSHSAAMIHLAIFLKRCLEIFMDIAVGVTSLISHRITFGISSEMS